MLNLNNLRDSKSDRKSGKNTLVVQIGYSRGVRYHFLLCLVAFLSLTSFVLLQENPAITGICLLPFIIIGVHLRTVFRVQEPASLDPELKKLALSTFLIAFLLYLANGYFL